MKFRNQPEILVPFWFALVFGVIASEFLLLMGCSPWVAVLLGFFWCAITFIESEP